MRLLLPTVALLCLLACIGVYSLRAISAWRIAAIAPGVAETSGCEEEALLSLHRAVHGEPVYIDRTRPPFAGAYFNWLFYAGYGAFVQPVAAAHGDQAILPAGRLLSAAGGVLGALALAWLAVRCAGGARLTAAALAASVFAGPLVGWWAHTVRPDIWGLVLETIATAVLLVNYRARPRLALVAAGALYYAAWAFKLTFVFSLGTAALFLLLRRRWAAAIIMLAANAVLWLLTFRLMGPDYRAAFLGTATSNVYALAHGWQNLLDAGTKSLPILGLLGGLLIAGRFRLPCAGSLAGDTATLGLLGLVLSGPAEFFLSCKMGAYSNYFFTPLLMAALACAGLLAAQPRTRLLIPAFGLMLALQLALLSGRVGRLDLQPAAHELSARWAVWQQQPEPRFSLDNRLNQPWLNPDSLPLVLPYNYLFERQAGMPFEREGVGGLIARGYFASLLLPAGSTAFDGADLHLYTPVTSVSGMTVYRRRDLPSP